MSKMKKIGYIQLAPVFGDMEATIRRIDEILKQVTSADILVLPELCNSGYNFMSYEQAWKTSEEIDRSLFIKYLEDVCKKNNFFIVSGFNERCRDSLYNSAILVSPKGYVGRYRKLHLFMNEKDFFKPGNEAPPLFDTGGCKIGILICFDWIFPEVWRILALKGAEIICHPSNLVLPGLAQRAIPVHALTNRIFIVTANRVGNEGNLTFTGLSIVADPRGDILLQASDKEEEVGIVQIKPALARDKNVTPKNDIFKDRRADFYDLLAGSKT
ncbi:MAG TPA: nitrilase-related carbon-nitrogen hydrolase [Desulfobacteraceae bacterium]|nr:nitrilase-related carbon-nitrogen hydrolase [Desulfobacteraceae bacterium]HPJ67498.1 nitrilase-related carbon-nitrogen hydrolase [Desulfobacteraceae bacterium]HPQ29828.1 nitrilase-related carbon-nitrogen hydrolase [Desulfobacteraceae bacterium]